MQFRLESFWAIRPLYRWGALALVIITLLAWHYFGKSAAAPDAATQVTTSHVHLSSVAALSSPSGPLPVTGKVTSRSQATVLSESSGQIVSLRHSIGDRVGAGEIIASMENSSQQAAVTQAQGSYDAAQAALSKASGSTVQNSNLTSVQAQQSAQNALTGLGVAMQSMYAALDDGVHAKADTLFYNPDDNLPTYIANVPDSQLVNTMQNERSSLRSVLSDAKNLTDLNASNVDANEAGMITDAQSVGTFIADVIQATNKALPNQNVSASTIAAGQSTLAAARTELVSAVSALNSAKSAYDSALTNAQTAANSASTATGSDVDMAQASLKQALGALDAAKANLEKTVIRSPISGTIVTLPIHQGDFVAAFSQVAEISNPQALEVDAYVTPDDAKTLAVGGKATIDGSTTGIITFVAPALDPSTNKIEVKIGIIANQDALADGDTETVTLSRSTTPTKSKAKANADITIPIVAVKITPEGPVVFSVGTSSALVAHPIALGTILGDQITVASGLTPDMSIITDARGHAEGETVIVDTQ